MIRLVRFNEVQYVASEYEADLLVNNGFVVQDLDDQDEPPTDEPPTDEPPTDEPPTDDESQKGGKGKGKGGKKAEA